MAKQVIFAKVAWFLENFGIQQNTLERHNVTRDSSSKIRQYDVADAIIKIPSQLFRDAGQIDVDETEAFETLHLPTLDAILRREQIRKLKLDNDERSRVLVPASEVGQAIDTLIRVVSDSLDSLPSEFKKRVPNVDQRTMAILVELIGDARRAAADADLEDDDAGD